MITDTQMLEAVKTLIAGCQERETCEACEKCVLKDFCESNFTFYDDERADDFMWIPADWRLKR